jgi:hypothetical protein
MIIAVEPLKGRVGLLVTECEFFVTKITHRAINDAIIHEYPVPGTVERTYEVSDPYEMQRILSSVTAAPVV